MTVKELRRLLKEKPQDATVLLSGYEFGFPGRGVHFQLVSSRDNYAYFDPGGEENWGQRIDEELVVLL